MALSVVQHKSAEASAASIAITFDSAVGVDSLILVGATGAGGVAIDTVVDNSGTNTYAEDKEQVNPGSGTNSVCGAWSAINGSSGAHQVTMTPTAATILSVHIAEVTGNATASIGDGTNGAEADDVTSIAAGSITTTNADDILFTVISSRNNFVNLAKDANYTTVGTFQSRGGAAYRIVSSTDTYNSTWTFDTEDVAALHVAYKAAAAGTTLTPAQAAVALAGQAIRLGFTILMPDEL